MRRERTASRRRALGATSSRRRALGATASAAAAALAGCASLRTETDLLSGGETYTSFVLGGRAAGWEGLAPEAIREERNPLLRMPPGETVEITLRNLDDEPHGFVVESSTERRLVEVAPSAAPGGRTFSFKATRAMTTYYDPRYPVQMRGEVLVAPE